MERFKIDDVAKICGMTKRTIRYYEEIGLLFPPERTEGGFRMYSELHIERLRQIANTREVLGISLQEVQEFVSISEQLNNQRLDIKQTKDDKEKYEKLLELQRIIEKQLEMINQKINKIIEIRETTHQYYSRVLAAIAKFEHKKE